MDWMTALETHYPCYGEAEIAELLGISRSAVSHMRRRGNCGMPEENFSLRMGPVWLAESINAWLVLEIEFRHLIPANPIPPSRGSHEIAQASLNKMLLHDEWLTPPPLAMAFVVDAVRAKHDGLGALAWRNALIAFHADFEPVFVDVFDEVKDMMLGSGLWPWRQTTQA